MKRYLFAALFVVLTAPVALMQSGIRPVQNVQPFVSQEVRGIEIQPAATAPDGTSVSMVLPPATPLWFAARIEGGKSYVAEAILAGKDRNFNDLAMTLWENDGTTPYAGNSDCSAETNSAAPSMQVNSAGFSTADGQRCTLTPDVATQLVLIRVISTQTGTLAVRLRETTVYSRWTVNSYNMYVPIHNPSQSSLAGWVLYYPEVTTGTFNGYVAWDNISLGGWGSTQFFHANSSITPNRGQLRIVLYKGTDLQLQTYAFNPATGNYLIFYSERLNHGSGNTW